MPSIHTLFLYLFPTFIHGNFFPIHKLSTQFTYSSPQIPLGMIYIIRYITDDDLSTYPLLLAGAAIGPLGFTVSAPGKDAFYSRPLPWIPSYHHNTMRLIGESVWDLVCSPSFYYALYMLYSFLLISTHSGNLFLS